LFRGKGKEATEQLLNGRTTLVTPWASGMQRRGDMGSRRVEAAEERRWVTRKEAMHSARAQQVSRRQRVKLRVMAMVDT